MGRIHAFNKSALKRSPDEWVRIEGDRFPLGKRPWSDLYTSDVVEKVAKTIELNDDRELFDLRLLLSYACEECFKTFGFVGGAAAAGKKQAWRNKAISDAKTLKNTLANSDDYFPAFTNINNDKRSIRIYPNSATRKISERLLSGIDELVTLLESADRAIEREKSFAVDDIPPPTSHSLYLQHAVDQFTAVFIHFRGVVSVKRYGDDKEIVGGFPDFVRTAAEPTLMAYYIGYAENPKRPSNLNVQIQEAVKRTSLLREAIGGNSQ